MTVHARREFCISALVETEEVGRKPIVHSFGEETNSNDDNNNNNSNNNNNNNNIVYDYDYHNACKNIYSGETLSEYRVNLHNIGHAISRGRTL
jgi:hypothetical protein